MSMCVSVSSSNTYILELDNSVILLATSRWGLFNPFLKKWASIKKKRKSKKIIPTNNGYGLGSVIERIQPQGLKWKIRGRKLRRGVNWQGSLKGRKHVKRVQCVGEM